MTNKNEFNIGDLPHTNFENTFTAIYFLKQSLLIKCKYINNH